MSGPRDPFSFDFGIDFKSVADRIKGEQQEREDLTKRLLRFHVTFLDDILRGILPHDLILLGAETGAGKTQLATLIAMMNARVGKRVHYFALEAEPSEIERRIKFSLLAEFAGRNGRDISDLNYPDWYLGRCESIVGPFNDAAERTLATDYRHLQTFYRGSKFGHDEIRKLLLAIQSETDLIVLDHLHYVDIEDENENRGFKQTCKMIRDVTLGMGKPMILIAHLRKRDMRARSIVPDIEMFHGSSDIFKIVTHAIMLAPARSMPSKRPGISNTFIHVPKDRMGGATGLIALCAFHRSLRAYDQTYTLGRAVGAGDEFEPIDLNERPRWAKGHRALYGGVQ